MFNERNEGTHAAEFIGWFRGAFVVLDCPRGADVDGDAFEVSLCRDGLVGKIGGFVLGSDDLGVRWGAGFVARVAAAIRDQQQEWADDDWYGAVDRAYAEVGR
jgi:hypothetical protein